MSLSKTRAWVLGTAVLSILLVLATYFLLIAPQRAEAAELRQQTEDTRSTNAQLAAKVEQLKVQFAELPQRQAELAAIRQAMPEEVALPTLVRDLDAMATSTGVTLMSLAPGEPSPVAAPVQATADGTAPAAVPAAGADLLVGVPTSITLVGDFYESELFLKNLQTEMPRAFLVQTLSVQAEKEAPASGGKPATVNGDVTMVITGSVFVLKPADSAVAPGTVTAPPAGTPAQPATAPEAASDPSPTADPSSTATP